MKAPSGSLGVGDRLGRFEILRAAGSGSQGEVYRARDRELGRTVAVKVLPAELASDGARLARFEQEARLLAGLNDPRIATLFEVCQDDGRHFLVMELVPGETLAERFARGPLSPGEALPLFVQLAEALEHAHREGVVHRDLKPANVKVTADGGVKVLDFGIAKALVTGDGEGGPTLDRGPPEQTAAGALLGTLTYMSPEQARGQAIDQRTDIWAFGCLLYEALSGRRAFGGETHGDTLAAILRASPDWEALPEDLPRGVRRLLRRCLEKEPRERLQHIGDARVELEEALRAGWPDEQEDASAAPAGFRAILCTQLMGVSMLRQRLGVRVGSALLERHDELFRECLREASGHELDHLGDGFVASFARPSEALRCALAFDRALSRVDGDEPLVVRMGIHAGELDSGGDVVDSAARVLGLAEERQLLLTEVVFDSSRRDVSITDLEWLAHGAYRFVGREAPLQIFEVGVRGRSALRPPRDTELAQRALSPGEAETLGWRPARGLSIPGRAHWIVGERMGEGGFGEVWLAVHEKTQARRVFKFCFDAERVRGLQREVVLFRLLKEALGERDDIAEILDWQFERPPFFLEVAHTEGGDLARWCEAQGGVGAVPLEVRLELVAQIAVALGAAHGVGVLHKDVKPSNILVSESVGADGPKACLTDFGIGLITDREVLAGRNVTVAGFTRTLLASSSSPGAGTALYMAPEVAEGRTPTIQSDLYGLGVVLYQLVVGDLSRSLAPGWERGVEDELLREDIAACVDGNPERRLGSAGELVQRLRGLERRRAERDEQRRARRDAELASRRRRLFLAAALIGSLLVVAIALVAWRETRQRREAEKIQYVASVQFAEAALDRKDRELARDSLLRTPERLRGWEWGHLVDRAWPPEPEPGEVVEASPGQATASLWDGRQAAVLARLQEPPQTITVQFDTTGGQLVVTAGQTVKVWDLEQATPVFERTLPMYVHNAALSHDGRLLGAGLSDRTAVVWDVASGERLQRLEGHTDFVMKPWFSPDDSLMVTRSNDRTVRVWSTTTWQQLQAFEEGTEEWPAFQVVHVGKDRVLLASQHQSVRVWDLATGEPERVIQGPSRPDLAPLAISPGGAYVLSTRRPRGLSMEGALLWSTRSGQALYEPPTLPGAEGPAVPTFSPDGSCLAVFYGSGELQLIETETGRVLAMLTGLVSTGRWLAWSSDGSRLALAALDGTILVIGPSVSAPEPRDRLGGHSDWVTQAVWSSDGARLATVSYDRTVAIWDVAARARVATLGHDEAPVTAELSPDGRLVWTWTYARHFLWRAATGELLFEYSTGIPVPSNSVRSPFIVYTTERCSDRHFSPSGDRIALPFVGGVQVVDTASGETLLVLPGEVEVEQVAYGPRGDRIFGLSEDRLRITAWDAASGAVQYVVDARSALGRYEPSPDGRRLAAGALDGSLHIWDARTGRQIHRLDAHDAALYTVRFDRTGERLITHSQDGTSKVWDVESGRLVATAAGSERTWESAALSPDGTRILRGAGQIFDLDGNLLVTLRPAGFQMRWSPDGRTVASPWMTGEVRLWETIPWPELAAIGDAPMPFEERLRLWRGRQQRAP